MTINEAQTMTVPVTGAQSSYPVSGAVPEPVPAPVPVPVSVPEPVPVPVNEPPTESASEPAVERRPEAIGPTGTSRRSFMDRLRTPVAAAIAGGVLLLGAGFGTGFAVGHHHAGPGAGARFHGGPGGNFGGGPGLGWQQGQAAPQGQQNQQGQQGQTGTLSQTQ